MLQHPYGALHFENALLTLSNPSACPESVGITILLLSLLAFRNVFGPLMTCLVTSARLSIQSAGCPGTESNSSSIFHLIPGCYIPLIEDDVLISFRRHLVETCLSHKGSMDLNTRMNYNYLLIGAQEVHDYFRFRGGPSSPSSSWVIHNTEGHPQSQEIAPASHFTSRLPKELCHLSFFPRSQWPGQST